MLFRNFLILSTKCPLKHFNNFLNRGVTRTNRDRINFEHAVNESKQFRLVSAFNNRYIVL